MSAVSLLLWQNGYREGILTSSFTAQYSSVVLRIPMIDRNVQSLLGDPFDVARRVAVNLLKDKSTDWRSRNSFQNAVKTANPATSMYANEGYGSARHTALSKVSKGRVLPRDPRKER